MLGNIDEFVSDCCLPTGDGTMVSAHDLTGVYLTWCEQRAVRPLSPSHFCEALHAHGFGSEIRSHERCYVGLTLTGPVVTDYILSSP